MKAIEESDKLELRVKFLSDQIYRDGNRMNEIRAIVTPLTSEAFVLMLRTAEAKIELDEIEKRMRS
jgi:hypothetical protein